MSARVKHADNGGLKGMCLFLHGLVPRKADCMRLYSPSMSCY